MIASPPCNQCGTKWVCYLRPSGKGKCWTCAGEKCSFLPASPKVTGSSTSRSNQFLELQRVLDGLKELRFRDVRSARSALESSGRHLAGEMGLDWDVVRRGALNEEEDDDE